MKEVLGLLQRNSFYIWVSKYDFGVASLTYLGHIISAAGVQPDPEKISVVKAWPPPKSVKQVRAFMGLTGYYQRFVEKYAQVAAPLSDLVRKDNFHWDAKTEITFQVLKEKLTSTPVFIFPNFSLPFIIETDACEVGVRAILLQKEHPITYYRSE